MHLSRTLMAKGHPNVRATHATTLEITRDPHLTQRGDCVVLVSADGGLADMDDDMREAAREPRAVIKLTIEMSGLTATVAGRGDVGLTWAHPTDIVARMSSYTCPRTLMVHADRAAIDLPRELVRRLRNPETVATVTIGVEIP